MGEVPSAASRDGIKVGVKMSYQKYKDAPPGETISQIKKIYSDMGLKITDNVVQRLPEIYSAVISDNKNNWHTCGKGTTREYCLASGYAESIEHLCSHFAYDLNRVSPEANSYLGFLRYPDEKREKFERIHELAPQVYNDMLLAYRAEDGQIDETALLESWRKFLQRDEAVMVPWYSVRTGETTYLPDDILSVLCGTNGGGAGNTTFEAIGHGVDEICERYAKTCIYRNHLTPPGVPITYIEEHHPDIVPLIKTVEEKTACCVIVKDASLGTGLAVLAVILVNKKTQEYLVNFGSHPVFEIALERCLTEMFQAYSLHRNTSDRKTMERWAAEKDEDADSNLNWVSLLRDDTGIVPNSFFGGTPSWDFAPWPEIRPYSNAAGLRQQLNSLLKMKVDDIYIRDIGYLGFPVYRVYIPKVSTTGLQMDSMQENAFSAARKLEGIIKMSDEDLPLPKDILELARKVFSSDEIAGSILLGDMNNHVLKAFLAAAFYDAGDKQQADKILYSSDSPVCKCILNEQILQQQGVPVSIRDELLSVFFDHHSVSFAKHWREKRIFPALLKSFLKRKGLSNDCDNLHMMLKERFVSMPRSQDNLKSLIESLFEEIPIYGENKLYS